MTADTLSDIRQSIVIAQQFEQTTGQFNRYLQQHSSRLPSAIKIDAADDLHALEAMVMSYLKHVPDFLEAIYQIANQAGITDDIEPFLAIAEDFFIKPPEIVEEHQGLGALMDEAYLAHRLMEELNDRFIQHCGIPLAPLDMIRANVIIHHLIGEPFANELDEIVHCAAENLLCDTKVFSTPKFQQYAQEHANRGWSEELKRWPCLTQDLDVVLDMPTTQQDEQTLDEIESEFTVH